jgi:hypothetical protein
MKTYRQLVESLPSKTVVFAFGRFQPPTTGHELLVRFVKKLAQQSRADHVIYASRTQDSKKNPLTVERKIHYLKLLFPGVNFKGANDRERTFLEAAKALNTRYKNIIMVAGSDRVAEYTKLLEKYNGTEFKFDSIKVVSAGERDPDADDTSGMSATKMRAAATKGDINMFKRGLPNSVRDIDARRLMNDVREGLGLEAIKEQIKLSVDELREKYFRKEIYNVGDIVESIDGTRLEIIKRGTNHLLCKDDSGNIQNRWIHEVVQTKDV